MPRKRQQQRIPIALVDKLDKWTVGQVDSGQWDNWTLGQLGNMQCDKICPLIAPSSEYKNLSMTAGFNTLFAN